MAAKRAILCVFSITACNGGGGSGVDATPTVDIDNGSCGDQLNFTGELVDWDSSMAAFCGVNNAMMSGGGAMDSTAPNGRFEMCIPPMNVTNLDVAFPNTNSPCASPASPYTLPAIAVANPATIRSGAFWSGRVPTMARQGNLGVTLEAGKAHVVVHVDKQARAVAITATHGAAQAYNGTAWAAGESGEHVFFPNVDVPATGGTTTLSVVGGAVGTGVIPLAPGKLTLVTVRPL